MVDVTSLGELLIDFTQTGRSQEGTPLYAAYPGGAPANVAVSAARLGARAAFIGTVGEDCFGSYLRQTLQDNHVDTQGITTTSRSPTSMSVVSVSPSGERDFFFYRSPGADTLLSPNEIPDSLLTRTKFLHVGSVSLTHEPARSATLSSVHRAKQNGALISYDPNYRAKLWPESEQALYWLSAPLEHVDILKLSRDELLLLTGTDNLEQGSRQLADLGVAMVLITLGERGAYYHFQNWSGTCPGIQVKVADTNGAGDTFLGAVLAQLSQLGAEPLRNIRQESQLRAIIFTANCAASLTCTKSGAIPAMPTRTELDTLLSVQKGW